jgi:hypothetical protein
VQPQLKDSYSEMGRPSIDPELLLRMLLIEYLYGITSERKLVEELRMHLAWRWFTGPGFDQEIPHHSTKLISSSILRYTLTCTGTNSGTHLEFSMGLPPRIFPLSVPACDWLSSGRASDQSAAQMQARDYLGLLSQQI